MDNKGVGYYAATSEVKDKMKDVLSEIQSGKTSATEIKSKDSDIYMVYTKVPNTPWSIGITVPLNEVLGGIKEIALHEFLLTELSKFNFTYRGKKQERMNLFILYML